MCSINDVIFYYLQKAIKEYTFIIFLVLMCGFVLFVYFLVPETKNKTFEEIASQFQPGGVIEVEEIVDDDDVFKAVPTEDSKLMMGEERKRNGSVASNEKNEKYLPEDKMSLTHSVENIDQKV